MPFWSILRKDLRMVSRDRSALIFIFAMPLMFIVLFGMMFSGNRGRGGGNPIKVLATNQDKGPHGAELVTAMRQVGLQVEEVGDEPTMAGKVKSGERPLGVIISPDFSARLEEAVRPAAGTAPQARLRLLVDPAQSNLAEMTRGAIFGATQRVVGPLYREAALQRVPPEYREYAQQMLGGGAGAAGGVSHSAVALDVADIAGAHRPAVGDLMVPSYAVLFVFFMANGVAVSLITERQEGTLRRMLSAPITPGQILFGKLLARGVLGGLQVLMLFAIGRAILHMSLGSSVLGLALTAIASIFAATGLGLLIASFGKTTEQIAGMTTLALVMMGAISGCMVPRPLLPDILQKISKVTPHAWALDAYNDLLLRNLPLTATFFNIVVVFLFGLGFYGLALARLRYE
jgi:ABC-2 type transport system permease protein